MNKTIKNLEEAERLRNEIVKNPYSDCDFAVYDKFEEATKTALQEIRDELDDEIEFLDKFISDIRIKKRVEKLWNKRQKIQEALKDDR